MTCFSIEKKIVGDKLASEVVYLSCQKSRSFDARAKDIERKRIDLGTKEKEEIQSIQIGW